MSIRPRRERSADLLATHAAVGRILTSSATLEEAAPKLLAAIGELLGWRLGALWIVQPDAGTIACVEAWADARVDAERFLAGTRAAVLGSGEGMPGRVWAAGEPEWVADLPQPHSPSELEVSADGIRVALCFPIRGSSGVLGAIQLLAGEPRRPDAPMLDLTDAIGHQLGDYIERKRAERSVQESEARKAAVLRAAHDAIVMMDHEGRVVEFNPAAERTFGYTAAEVLGKELADTVIPPDLREQHRQALARFIATRESDLLERTLELRGMRKDGSQFPLEVTIATVPGEPPMFTGYLRDLSERREAEALERRLAAIVQSSDDAILSKDRERVITSWNAGAENLYGYTAQEAIGMPIQRLVPPHREGEEVVIFDRVLRGEAVRHYETERVRKDGTQVDVALTVSPLRDSDGEVVGASVIARDISERKRVEERRAELLRLEQETRARSERAERRASFLAEAQALLSSSLDHERTLTNLARLAVPHIADWCAIDLVAADGSLERLAMTHVDPAKQLLAKEIEKRYPARQHPERGALKAVLSGESELVVEIPDSLLDEATHDEEHARLIRQLGIRSAMVVPLMARERAIGAITLVSAESGRAFELDDLRLAEELAGRAAIAVDNARLYGERSYIASTLQQALMPDNLPEVPGAELAARYSAAGEVNEVGGDFYDIYRLGEATWGLAIGDVRGKGPRAAAVTALVRYTLRTASLDETVPSRVLAVLNEAMLRQSADDRFCTAAYASIHPNGRGGFRMTLGVGGHPLPLLLRRNGSVEPVGSPGTLIGFVPDPEIVDEQFELQPGDALVLYTDGVSEARSAHDLYGEERLMRLLGRCAGLGAAEIAERIENEVLDFQEGAASDDLAVLVLRVHDRSRLDGALEVELLEPVRKAPA